VAAVGLDDFPDQGQSEARAAAFSRVEWQQCLGHDIGSHPRSPIVHLDPVFSAVLGYRQLHALGRPAGLMGVLHEVDQGLRDLRAIETARC